MNVDSLASKKALVIFKQVGLVWEAKTQVMISTANNINDGSVPAIIAMQQLI